MTRRDPEMTTLLEEYIRLVREVPDVSPEEEGELLRKAGMGNRDAKNRLIEAYLKAVPDIADKYSYCGLPAHDLIQEGNTGLLKAVENYNDSMRVSFADYAAFMIRREVSRLASTADRSVSIPREKVELIRSILDAGRRIMKDAGREPTDAEIGSILGISEDEVHQVMSTYIYRS